MTSQISPFRIDIPDLAIQDLHDRLARTRWSDQLPGDPATRGVTTDDLRRWADHWRTSYDWRAHEAELNRLPQFTTEIDDHTIHFVHVRSANPDALPLLITHGWPNTFVEFTRTIPLLAEHFHVVVPSVPGFAFSEPPRDAEMTVPRVARTWVELMRRLGYDRYGTQGGDLGAYIAPAVAEADPEHVVGVHLDGGIGFPTEADLPEMSEEERAEFEMMQSWQQGGVDHHVLLREAPQTFAHGWNDSPVGLLAWMLQKFDEFTPMADAPEDVMEVDHILTNVSLYWFTGTVASSSWPMYNGLVDGAFGWPRGQGLVPTGVYAGGPPLWRRLAERTNIITHWPEGNPGNHFVAMEEPHAHVADILTFFSALDRG
ncbi:epoxide hydrolase family protein [Aeromicrobium sp. CTD01-1L150]|uniref:epoxide hydrolase family protein n=1 Tax=Aeromicrobium sp. CTD01-1L150 TaxID=3341830 RepID=UPI0035BF9EB2